MYLDWVGMSVVPGSVVCGSVWVDDNDVVDVVVVAVVGSLVKGLFTGSIPIWKKSISLRKGISSSFEDDGINDNGSVVFDDSLCVVVVVFVVVVVVVFMSWSMVNHVNS